MFDFTKWTNDNILSLITLVFAVVGGVFAYMQWRKSTKLKCAEFINEIMKMLRFDKEMGKALYLIDYNHDWYDEDFHGGGENEFLIDKLLSYLSYICYLIKSHNITKAEVQILDYELRRACECKSVQAYLWNLYWWSISRNSICSFQYLIDYGLSHNIIAKEDFQQNSRKYPKHLNLWGVNRNCVNSYKLPKKG